MFIRFKWLSTSTQSSLTYDWSAPGIFLNIGYFDVFCPVSSRRVIIGIFNFSAPVDSFYFSELCFNVHGDSTQVARSICGPTHILRDRVCNALGGPNASAIFYLLWSTIDLLLKDEMCMQNDYCGTTWKIRCARTIPVFDSFSSASSGLNFSNPCLTCLFARRFACKRNQAFFWRQWQVPMGLSQALPVYFICPMMKLNISFRQKEPDSLIRITLTYISTWWLWLMLTPVCSVYSHLATPPYATIYIWLLQKQVDG